MLRTTMTSLPAALLLVTAVHTYAETTVGAAQTTGEVATMTEGEIKKIDVDQKKLTIKHGEIKNLGMPPMTMVFKVKDPAMLSTVKAGDKVAFIVEKSTDGYMVMSLQARN